MPSQRQPKDKPRTVVAKQKTEQPSIWSAKLVIGELLGIASGSAWGYIAELPLPIIAVLALVIGTVIYGIQVLNRVDNGKAFEQLAGKLGAVGAVIVILLVAAIYFIATVKSSQVKDIHVAAKPTIILGKPVAVFGETSSRFWGNQ